MIGEAIKVCIDTYKEGKVNWPMLIYLSLVHIAGIYGISYIPYCSKYTLVLAFVLWPFSICSLCCGAHRLWSHRTYKAHIAVRIFLLIGVSFCNQGSIWHWARDHRVHHKYVETEADPHNARRGFFFSHVGWLLVKKHKDVGAAGKTINLDDLRADPVVMFSKKYDPWFNQFITFIVPGLLAMCWGDNFWNGFWVAGALRCTWTWQMTWLVNSAAHYYGDKPYDPNAYAVENPIVACLTMGEGWHNWHHKYPFDYAASEFGVTTQFNPAKLFIDSCAAAGLVWDRKRATGAWAKKRMLREQEIYGQAGLSSRSATATEEFKTN